MSSRLVRSALPALLAVLVLGTGVPCAGAQTFTKVTNPANPIVTNGGAPAGSFVGASWIDSDGDGDLDLFVSQVGLFRNDGGGAFAFLPEALPNAGFPIGNTWADVDNDGDLDCFLAGGRSHGSALYRNDGGNQFTKLTGGSLADTTTNGAWGCAFGDADGDGRIDVVTAAAFGFNGADYPNRFLRNLGSGVFTRVDTLPFTTAVGPYTTPSWSDFDGDGDLDLFLAAGPANGTRAPDFLYTNRRESSPFWFTRITTPPLGTDSHDGQLYNWIDVDNDGDLDVYLTNFGASVPLPNDLYRNDGGGFVRLTGADVGPIVTDAQLSLASVWQDFDNDGDLDCYVTNAGAQPAKLYRNDGGTFTSLSIAGLTANGPHWGASGGDFDGDGDIDLFVAGTSATFGLYENTTVNANGWLDVTLTAVRGNRAAIGAKVRVRAVIGGVPRWQMREVSAQNSFGGMNSLVQHFGLGDAAVADSVVIEWPGGGRSVRTGVPARTTLAVVEDAATATAASLVKAEVEGGAVHLTWWLASTRDVAAMVERSANGGWEALGAATLDGSNTATWVDAGVAPGRWAYRLRVRDAAGEAVSAETVVEVPGEVALAIRAVTPNPAPGRVTVTFDLPRAGEATLELLDVSGRRVARVATGSLGSGRYTRTLGPQRLPAGVYLVRLVQSGRAATARATVVN